MVIVLDHTAHGNGKTQLVKDLQGNVYLSSSAVHHDQVREPGKASHTEVAAFVLQLPDLPHPVGKAPGEHLLHGSIIIGSLNGLDLKFPVIAALWLSILIHHHGTHGLHSAGVGDIKRLHTPDSPNADQLADLVHGADGTQLLLLDPLLILGQYKLRIPCSQFHQALLLPLFRHHNTHLLAPSGS